LHQPVPDAGIGLEGSRAVLALELGRRCVPQVLALLHAARPHTASSSRHPGRVQRQGVLEALQRADREQAERGLSATM